MAKIKKMSKEELEAIKKVALEKIETMEIRKGRRSESEDFLLEIKEVISKALDKEIPFTQISKLIKDMYSIDVSVNILKSFSKNHLNYVPKKRPGANAVARKIKATASVEDKVNNKIDMTKMSVAEMKKATAESGDELDNLM